MADLVILTARFGHGHLSAAENIQAAVRELYPELSVELVDPFLLSAPRTYDFMRKLYWFATNNTPLAWYLFFVLTDRTRWGDWGFAANRRGRRIFRDLAGPAGPQVVVSTYPVYASAVERFCGPAARRSFRLITVITDSVTINRSWLRGESDAYVAADALTRDVLVREGVPPDRIHVTGFPTPLRFAAIPDRTDNGSAEAYPGPFRALYLPNQGTRNFNPILRTLAADSQWTLELGLGHNRRLHRLVGKNRQPARPEGLVIREWIPDMPERMMQADLIITKAGGATVHEALAAGKPLVISQVTPGQEEGNAHLIEELGLGMVIRRKADLARFRDFVGPDAAEHLARCRRQVELFRRPDASYRIADLVASLRRTPN